tara:strand:+ start:1120 stop:1323 length:204 start_codon:yes stop_codon:yes gene_type:complete
MKDNFQLWEFHYREFLSHIYDKIVILFLIHNTEPPTYEYFAKYSYRNTKKTRYYHPVHGVEIHAQII